MHFRCSGPGSSPRLAPCGSLAKTTPLLRGRILSVVRYEWSRAKTGRDKSAIDNDDDDSVDPGAYVRYI